MWQRAGGMNVARSTSRIWLWRACSLDWGWHLDFGAFSRFSCRSIVASLLGVWLYSVQHRFEHALWAQDANWSFTEAALRGSSCLRLPRILEWFTGNIGFHHIHHLNPRIPNYRLEDCHGMISGMEAAPILTLRTAITTVRYALWDENLRGMVSFHDAIHSHSIGNPIAVT